MAELDAEPDRAIELCTRAMFSTDFSLAEEAKKIISSVSNKYGTLILKHLEPLMFDDKIGWRFEIDDSFSAIFHNISFGDFKSWMDKGGIVTAKKIARHLPSPYLDASDSPQVPELTLYVLEKFGNDDDVFHAFCIGRHSGQLYSGDIVAAHEREVEVAKRFFAHPVKRIRDWAKEEARTASNGAAFWRQRNEEMIFEDR